MSKNLFDIIYEDDDLIAINKVAGVLTLPDRYNPALPNIKTELAKLYETIIPIHRLDKGTSGILIFGRNKHAHKTMSQAFEHRKVTKIYQTFVYGRPSQDHFIIEAPIKERHDHTMMIHSQGKKSTSECWVVEAYRNYALLDVQIHTGRTHQIRVHLQHYGYPLAVDSVYGYQDAFFVSTLKKKYNRGKNEDERPLMSRPCLHASRLIFDHPNTNNSIEIKAPLPKDMRALQNQLRKLNGL